MRIEGPIGPISEEIADLMPLGSEDYHGLLEILRSGKTIWYESGCKMLITREQKPSELCEDNPARSIEEDSFRGYTWQEDRDPLETRAVDVRPEGSALSGVSLGSSKGQTDL